jgi:rubredoxin
MRDRDATTSVRVPVVPCCPNCHEPSNVLPVHLTETYPGVQYWRCEACGFVWATRDGEDLRTIA